jgi:uncharacterized OB-fold protein
MNAEDVEHLIAAYPDFRIDHDNSAYYAGLLTRQLLINRCGACGTRHHPPKPVCPQCWSTDVTAHAVGGSGVIHLYTVYRAIDPVLGGMNPADATMVTVELDEQPGLLLTSKFVASVDPVIGDRVQLCWIDRCGAPFAAFEPAAGS